MAMGTKSIRALAIGMAVTLPLFAGSVLLPAAAGTSAFLTASAGIGLVAATFGLAAGIVAVLLACSAAVVLEMAPVGEFHVERPRDAASLTLFAVNGIAVATIGSRLRSHRSRQAAPAASEDALQGRVTPIGPRRTVMPAAACAPLSLRREPLTDREEEVLTLLATGMSNAEIGAELFISVNTVKSHLKNVYGKLGVDNRTRALSTALELGVISTVHDPDRGASRQARPRAGEDELAA
jgi:DNA-binding CsgD family transcriptional regulator